MLFIALPAGFFSTFLILIRSRLLHAYCSFAFGPFKPATYCSFSVVRCPKYTVRFLLFYSCFSLLGSYFSYLATRCSVFFVCSARYSLDATHGSYFTSCFLLIRRLLVLSRCHLSLIHTFFISLPLRGQKLPAPLKCFLHPFYQHPSKKLPTPYIILPARQVQTPFFLLYLMTF